VSWLSGVLIAAAVVTTRADDSSSSMAATVPTLPRAAPGSRKELPDALKKAVPVSISDLRTIQDHVTALVPKVSPAVVAVEIGFSSGSGVVISSDGLVLTAGHVAGRPNRDVKFIFPDGKVAHGRTIGADHDADTGLMRITDPGPWPNVPVGDLKHARLGDWVLALGHPGGFDAQRSLVVRLGRIISLVPGVLQSDCTISPGDSGGPLFDMHGRVIAIHSAISTSLDENFHVPITDVFDTWTELVSSTIPRPHLGATVVDDPPGCRLTAVESNSPAAMAGLKVGDHVVRVDGRDIVAAASLMRWLEETDPGDTLTLQVKRDDKTLSFALKLAPYIPK
jgi:serine protease Do